MRHTTLGADAYSPAIVGATYDTLRGRFKVVQIGRLSLTLERLDGRYLVAALSDWHTWTPQLVPLLQE